MQLIQASDLPTVFISLPVALDSVFLHFDVDN